MSNNEIDSNAGTRRGADRILSLGRLFWAVLHKQFTIILRYRVNFLAQLLGIYVFFALVFFGGQAMVGQASSGSIKLGSTLDTFVVGWFLWTTSIAAYSSLPSEIAQESEWGTLEQLYLSTYGFGTVMLAKATAKILQSVIVGSTVLALILITTRRPLAVDLLTVIPIVVLALCSLIGIGFIFAGLALVYKRVQNVSSLMNFVIMGLVAAPVASIPVLRYLPLVQGSGMLQRAMQEGVKLWEFPVTDLGILFGAAFIYLLIGILVFEYCSRVARKRGVMGHY